MESIEELVSDEWVDYTKNNITTEKAFMSFILGMCVKEKNGKYSINEKYNKII
jgi:hypothetical protein